MVMAQRVLSVSLLVPNNANTQNTAIVNIPSTADDYKIRFVDAGETFSVWTSFMTLDPLAAPVASGVISGTDETNPFTRLL